MQETTGQKLSGLAENALCVHQMLLNRHCHLLLETFMGVDQRTGADSKQHKPRVLSEIVTTRLGIMAIERLS